MAEYSISISKRDLQQLRAFASLPQWIEEEFNTRYQECNCSPLPVDAVARIVEKIDGFRTCGCGHPEPKHLNGECPLCKKEGLVCLEVTNE